MVPTTEAIKMRTSEDEELVGLAITRCGDAVMENAPFEQLIDLLEQISRRYRDRILDAEIKRARVAIRHLTALRRPSLRRQYLNLLVRFGPSLRRAILAARVKVPYQQP